MVYSSCRRTCKKTDVRLLGGRFTVSFFILGIEIDRVRMMGHLILVYSVNRWVNEFHMEDLRVSNRLHTFELLSLPLLHLFCDFMQIMSLMNYNERCLLSSPLWYEVHLPSYSHLRELFLARSSLLRTELDHSLLARFEALATRRLVNAKTMDHSTTSN